MEVNIRKAQSGDIPAIQTVAELAWKEAYAGIIRPEVQETVLRQWYAADSLAARIDEPGSLFYVAETAGELAGFAQIILAPDGVARMTRIYVLPARQRAGIGTLLLESGLRELHAAGATRLQLDVEKGNEKGIRFYERHGFSRQGEREYDLFGQRIPLLAYARSLAA